MVRLELMFAAAAGTNPVAQLHPNPLCSKYLWLQAGQFGLSDSVLPWTPGRTQI